MTLIFSGQSEQLPRLYRRFRGPYKEQMPMLISGRDAEGKVVDVPRVPISYAQVIERREEAPADVIKEWMQHPISTGDGVVYGPQGVLIVLDAKSLREINSESNFDDGALVLSDEQCRSSSLSEKEGIYSLGLTYDEVEEVDGTGYIKKSGEWVPANKTVAKVWDYLGRGRNLKSYAQLAAEHSRKIYGPSIESEGVMKISFHGLRGSYPPVINYWMAVSIDRCGGAIHPDFDKDGSCLVGVVPPSLLTCEKKLEARVAASLDTGKSFERGNYLWTPIGKNKSIEATLVDDEKELSSGLILNGKSEKSLEPYRGFLGSYKEQMPLLISGKDAEGKVVDVPRLPISFAHVIERRETAPADVIGEWRQHSIITGDGVGYGTQGEVLIALDAQPLREINAESEFVGGALILSNDQWSDLKARKDVLSLTWDEIDEVNGLYGTGYIRKGEVWVPANKTVAKIFDYLGRGRNLKEYAQLMGDYCNYYPTKDKDVMRLIFSQSYRSDDHLEEIFPIMRCFMAGTVNDGSITSDDLDLGDFSSGPLIGIAPDLLVAHEKMLEARIADSLDTGKSFERGNYLWTPIEKNKSIEATLVDDEKELSLRLILNGKSEKSLKPYRIFLGSYEEQMPLLVSGKDKKGNIVDVPRLPVSFAHVIERREIAPADVIEEWRDVIPTGDIVVIGVAGDIVSAWDSPLLRSLTSESKLKEGVFVLSPQQWNELKDQKEGALYLTAEEVSQANEKGYVKRNGKWVPANKTVAKIWEHLSRGRSLQPYIQMVSESTIIKSTYSENIIIKYLFVPIGITWEYLSRGRPPQSFTRIASEAYTEMVIGATDGEGIMGILLDTGRRELPTGQAWIVGSLNPDSSYSSSRALGKYGSLMNKEYGRLIGITPEALLAHEKTLEARLTTPPDTDRPSERETFYESLLRKIKGIK